MSRAALPLFHQMAASATLLCLWNAPFALAEGVFSSKDVALPRAERSRHHVKEQDPTEVKNGYALLYALASDEAQVNLVFVIKKGSPALRNALEKIAQEAKELKEDLESLREEDGSAPFGPNGLPAIEVATRALIRNEKRNRILSGGPGVFERELLLSQCEALTYGMSLLHTVAEKDPNAARRELLKRHAEKWRVLRRETSRLLQVADRP